MMEATKVQRSRAGWLEWIERRVNTLATIVLHAGAVLALAFVRPSTRDIAIGIGAYLVGMFVITAGYHRYFAHRTYKTSRAVQAVFAALGCLCTQKGALWWASTHRLHHRFTDAQGDPHSPHRQSFWRSHIGWTLSSESDGYDPGNVRDLSKYPELRWLDRFCTVPLVGYIVFTGVVGGLPGLAFWYCLPTVALMHAVMLVNSAAHLWGHRRFATSDQSRNNVWVALLTLGEGWHNNHHRYMGSTRQGFYFWQIDLTYYALRAMQAVGLVWDLREPPASVLHEGLMTAPSSASRPVELSVSVHQID
jgi:stearoyl-CoA desaturase (delta-9 desaturase)